MNFNKLLLFVVFMFLVPQLKGQYAQEFCGTDQIYNWRIQHDEEYKKDVMLRDSLIQSIIASGLSSHMRGGIYTIPVVIHVVHIGEPVGNGSNISDAVIISEIDELNDRMRRVIGDGVDCEIEFCLAVRDPRGNPSTGILRVNGSHVPKYVDEGIQRTPGCGADQTTIYNLSRWPDSSYVNIWLVNKICGAAGYAFSGGTVIDATIYWSGLLAHELGHVLSLHHTFQGDGGDANCPIDTNCLINGDQVCDTPPHKVSDCGATNPCSAAGTWTNVTRNYLSYCGANNWSRFTQGQKDRMIAFLQSPQKSALITSQGCVQSTCAVACNDNNACTFDICNNGVCTYQPMTCTDDHSCTIDACVAGVCTFTEMNCGDGDQATFDYCKSGTCQHTPYLGSFCENFTGFTDCSNYCIANGACENALTSPGWQNAGGDQTDWGVGTGTPVIGSGPDGDHTTGFGKFLYTNSVQCEGRSAVLLSPAFDLTTIPNPQLQFWHHMYGTYMGQLSVDVFTISSGTWTTLWSLSGNQGNVWNGVTLGLSAYMNDTVRFRFTGLIGNYYASDMAIDDVCVNSGCAVIADCNDNDACTDDICTNFSCTNTPIDCDDNSTCTSDQCQGGNCLNQPVANCIPCAEPHLNLVDEGTAADSIIVSVTGTIADLNVRIDIDHTYIRDLSIQLESPAGTTVNLFVYACLDQDSIRATFDDEGAAMACPPDGFSAVIPAQSLSAFDGESITGTWILRINDNFVDDTGILKEWCLITTYQNVSVSGVIISELGTEIQDVTVNLTGSSSSSMITGSDGLFAFSVGIGGNFSIAPTKTNDPNQISGISIQDIILIRRHILGNSFLNSPHKIIAADVSSSSTVTTLDISMIRKVILGVDSTFSGHLWKFVRSDSAAANPANPFPIYDSRQYSNISISKNNQDFIGIKLGDVNNSWDTVSPKMSVAGEVKFLIPELHARSGDEIVVPVTVKNFTSVAGFQFTLTWNSEVISLKEIINQAVSPNYGEQFATAGILTAAWDDAAGRSMTLNDNSIAFQLKFKVIGKAGVSSQIAIGSEITNSEAYNNRLDLLDVLPTAGSVKVEEITSAIGQHTRLQTTLSVQPNPFSGLVNIVFGISQDELVRVAIYDIFGRVVKTYNGKYSTGEHRLQWNGQTDSDLPLAPGIYHVKMFAGDQSKGIKAVLVK